MAEEVFRLYGGSLVVQTFDSNDREIEILIPLLGTAAVPQKEDTDA